VIRFTLHAEERLVERDITVEQVKQTIEYPDILFPGRLDRKIAIKQIDKRFLKIVFVKEGNDIIVITNHWISKPKFKEQL